MLSILPIITDYKSIERVNIETKKCLLWIVADKKLKENFKSFYDIFRKLNLDGLMVSGDDCEEIHDLFDDYFLNDNLYIPLTTWHNDKLDDIVFDFLSGIPTTTKDVQPILCLPDYDRNAYFDFIETFSKAANKYIKKYNYYK